jgi:hypothetical protein
MTWGEPIAYNGDTDRKAVASGRAMEPRSTA